jgi:uncharacterized protein YbjQ (UPF0145 family)
MILTTTDEIAGKPIAEVLGLVRGSSVRSAHVGRDVMAKIKNLVGGEVPEYTQLLAEAREQSLDRMVAEARARGADAIVAVRFASSDIGDDAAEMLAYGTAVKLG